VCSKQQSTMNKYLECFYIVHVHSSWFRAGWGNDSRLQYSSDAVWTLGYRIKGTQTTV